MSTNGAIDWVGDAAPPGRPAGRNRGRRVLFPVTGDPSPELARIAADLARDRASTLYLLKPVRVPFPTPLSFANTDDAEATVDHLIDAIVPDHGGPLPVHGLVSVGRHQGGIVRQAIDDHDIETLVVGESQPGMAFNRVYPGGLQAADCEVVAATRGEHSRRVASILVPVAGGPHSGLAVDVARGLANQNGAWIDLLRVVGEDATDAEVSAAEDQLAAARYRIADYGDADTWLLEASDATDAIIEQSQYYGLTILGAPRKGRLREFVFGSTPAGVRAQARGMVLTVRSGDDRTSLLGRLFPR